MSDLIFLQAPAGGGGGIANLIFLVGIIVVMYFFMIRPQMQARKKQRAFAENIKPNTRVVTIGGIHGTIISVADTHIVLLIDEKTKVKVQREAISMDMTNAAFPAALEGTGTSS